MRGPARAKERGAAAVELALVLPLLLTLVLGTIDWGYYFFTEQIVTNAAREGARVGSLTPYDGANPALDATSALDAETTASAYLAKAGLVPASATVSATANGASVIVTVSYRTGSLTGFLDSLLPARANAVAEMRR